MGNVTFNQEQQLQVYLLKTMLKLIPYWKEEIDDMTEQLEDYKMMNNNEIYRLQNQIFLYRYNLNYINKIIEQSHLSDEEKSILQDVYIDKIGNMEKIGNKYFYSDSGLRNRVNMILNKMLKTINNDVANLT